MTRDIGSSGLQSLATTFIGDWAGPGSSRLRERLRQRGLRVLDFVPNHAGMDHPWVEGVDTTLTELNLTSFGRHTTMPGPNGLGRPASGARSRSLFSRLADAFQLNYGNLRHTGL